MSELTDLEICNRIAKIKGFLEPVPKGDMFGESSDGWFVTEYFNDTTPDGRTGWKSCTKIELTDDALCHQLMIEFKVWIDWCNGGDCVAVINDKSNQFAIAEVKDKIPNRAICLAIIAAHKGPTP